MEKKWRRYVWSKFFKNLRFPVQGCCQNHKILVCGPKNTKKFFLISRRLANFWPILVLGTLKKPLWTPFQDSSKKIHKKTKIKILDQKNVPPPKKKKKSRIFFFFFLGGGGQTPNLELETIRPLLKTFNLEGNYLRQFLFFCKI